MLELPVCDGVVCASVLADAVSAKWAWTILGLFFASNVYPSVVSRWEDGVWRAERGPVVLAHEARTSEPSDAEFHDMVGWLVLLQEAWGRPEWPVEMFYDPLAEPVAAGVDCAASGEPILVDITSDPVSVRYDGELTFVVSAGRSELGMVTVGSTYGIVSASAIRGAVTTELGFELVRAVVVGAVIGHGRSDRRSLRSRLATAGSEAQPAKVEPGVLCLERRGPFRFGTSDSRRAALPSSAASHLLRAAAATGETARRPHAGHEIHRVIYAPDRIPRTILGPARRSSGDGVQIPDHPGYGRHHFESLFASGPDPWSYTSPYEQTKYEQTLALLPLDARGTVLELACAEGHFTAQLAPRVMRLVAADVSVIALERARGRCSELRNVEFVHLDLIDDALPGRDFDAVFCSEVLYFVARDELGAVAEKIGAAVRRGGSIILAHANLVSDEPDRSGFDWGLPFGAHTIGEVFASTRGLRLAREIRTPLYRIQLFRRKRPLRLLRSAAPEVTELPQPTEVPDRVKASVRWTGSAKAPVAPEPTLTERLPILMYHRIAAGGAPRYRVAPEAFEEQLAYLHEAGYRSVSSRGWLEAMLRRRPLPGRRVLLTFDDAYEDFLEEAWPRLKRHGFGALLFVVTDRVGGTAEWDRAPGEMARLLDWNQLELLAGESVEIGSHSASHRRLTALSTADVVEEAARSRAAIAERLGIVPEAFAYPYGDHDEVVEHLIGACGFSLGVTTRADHAQLADLALALPRIEVSGSMDLAGFVNGLERVVGTARAVDAPASGDQPSLAYDPELVPPLALMRTEGIDVLEEWFRWAEEWSVLLRVYGHLTERSRVLEIGCGLGRIAFGLRYLLSPGGTYDGFEIVPDKVGFLEQTFSPLYPNFRFRHADVHNTYYNPAGKTSAWEYRFPYGERSFDLVFAASVFTHALPEVVRQYFAETARVLAPNGRAVFSFFLLDHYRLATDRASGFDHDRFDLEHPYADHGDDFRIANPRNPEEMTGFRLSFVKAMAADAGLEVTDVVPGRWSGSCVNWIASQDLVVLEPRT